MPSADLVCDYTIGLPNFAAQFSAWLDVIDGLEIEARLYVFFTPNCDTPSRSASASPS